MISLLDVNVLIALFDPNHTHHDAGHTWFGRNRHHGWATCPLTENGVVRILSNPAYPGGGTTLDDAIRRLSEFRISGDHTFWADSVSLCDPELFDTKHVSGHRQLTDVYLLALAAKNRGRLATFDGAISRNAVRVAASSALVLIGEV